MKARGGSTVVSAQGGDCTWTRTGRSPVLSCANPPAEPKCRDRDADSGAVTVEAALGVGAVVAVFVLALAAMNMVFGQIRCTDAAVEAARLMSRGDRARAQEAVTRLAPAGATLAIDERDGRVTTEVSAPPLVGLFPAQWWSSRAAAALEPGVAAGAR